MSLPIDRTTLTAATVNQVPNAVIQSAKNIAAITTAFNGVDEVYNYATGLVSASTLSRLGIINVKDYGASGLATTTTGSITSGTKVLTLTATPDFIAGQGINLQGAFEVASLAVSAGASSSANCTVTLNGVAKTVALTSGNTATQVATAIRAASYPGWTTGGSGTTVTFTSNVTGTKTDASYTVGSTGATATMTTTTQGTADQISTVSSVNGLVINIADNATRTIAAGTIQHDDKVAIDSAFALNKPLLFPEGTYRYHGKYTMGSVNGISWRGQGTSRTIIKFTDSSVSGCIERIDQQSTGWRIEDLTFQGPGYDVGTINGLDSHRTDLSVASYNLRFQNVAFIQFSGVGMNITDWFQTSYYEVSARNTGSYGAISAGDQSVTFINSGSYNTENGDYSWWFQNGNPFLQNLNCGPVSNGIKFGRASGDPGGASYCFPTIIGLNIEYCKAGGTGMRFENGSGFAIMSGVNIYSNSASGAITYGIYMDYINTSCILINSVGFITTSGGSFTNKFYAAGGSSAGCIFKPGTYNVADYSTEAIKYLVNVTRTSGGSFTSTKPMTVAGYLYNQGADYVLHRTITTSITIRRDTGATTDNLIYADATSGNLTIDLDYAEYFAERTLRFKKIDVSANTVTITTIDSATIDGANTYVLATQYKDVTIHCDGLNWYIWSSN